VFPYVQQIREEILHDGGRAGVFFMEARRRKPFL
jgi:hypothetical protein